MVPLGMLIFTILPLHFYYLLLTFFNDDLESNIVLEIKKAITDNESLDQTANVNNM